MKTAGLRSEVSVGGDEGGASGVFWKRGHLVIVIFHRDLYSVELDFSKVLVQ